MNFKMNFKQNLEKFRNTFKNSTIWRLQVADELDNFVNNREIEISDDDFENVCEFVYDWITTTEATSYEVIEILFDGFKSGEISMSDLTDDYDYHRKLIDYVNDNF